MIVSLTINLHNYLCDSERLALNLNRTALISLPQWCSGQHAGLWIRDPWFKSQPARGKCEKCEVSTNATGCRAAGQHSSLTVLIICMHQYKAGINMYACPLSLQHCFANIHSKDLGTCIHIMLDCHQSYILTSDIFNLK